MAEPVTMVIDCDAGVDDALAIVMALGQPIVNLIAITCVNGNTHLDNVTVNVLKVLRTCGRLDVSLTCVCVCVYVGYLFTCSLPNSWPSWLQNINPFHIGVFQTLPRTRVWDEHGVTFLPNPYQNTE